MSNHFKIGEQEVVVEAHLNSVNWIFSRWVGRCPSQETGLLDIMSVATIIKFILLTLASCSNGQNLHCIPLRDCPSLMLLLQNRDEVPNMTRVQVYEYLSSKNCGFEGGINPKVECPIGKCIFFLFTTYFRNKRWKVEKVPSLVKR